MRTRSRPTGISFLVAVFAAAMAIECANRAPTDATPTAATTTLTSPSPAITLRAMGTVEILSCTPDGGCQYQGRVVNEGGCVKNVHGITHLLTFNTTDFQRYSGILVLDPATVTAPATPPPP